MDPSTTEKRLMPEQIQLLQEEERLLRELGKKVELGFNLMKQAEQLMSQSNLQPALEKLREAKAFFREEKSQVPVERALRAQIQLFERLNDSPKVLLMLQRLEAHHKEVGDGDDDLAECLSKQAMIAHDMGDLRMEVDVIKRLLPVLQRQGNKRSTANFCGAAAMALFERNTDLESAFELACQCELACRELGDVSRVAQALTTKAIILSGMKRLREALVACTESTRISKEHGISELIESNKPLLQQLLQEQFVVTYKLFTKDPMSTLKMLTEEPQQSMAQWAELQSAAELTGNTKILEHIAKMLSLFSSLPAAAQDNASVTSRQAPDRRIPFRKWRMISWFMWVVTMGVAVWLLTINLWFAVLSGPVIILGLLMLAAACSSALAKLIITKLTKAK